MRRILVIEDNTPFRKLIIAALEKAGYEVLDAPNGKEGFELFCERPCDLVITDIFMPQEDGIETILSLKAHFPNVKIIAISGGGLSTSFDALFEADEALKAAEIAEADRIMEKPIKFQQLIATVDELFNTTNNSC